MAAQQIIESWNKLTLTWFAIILEDKTLGAATCVAINAIHTQLGTCVAEETFVNFWKKKRKEITQDHLISWK